MRVLVWRKREVAYDDCYTRACRIETPVPVLGVAAMMANVRGLAQMVAGQPRSDRQPVLFIGHGSPMNIVRDNAFTQSLHHLGARIGKPSAVLVVSAHWLTRGGTRVATHPRPKTIYDFGGFPEELYRVTYPAPGAPEVAQQVAAGVTSIRVHADHEMGLDHGAWSVLHHLWPDADVPVFQLSIDYGQPPAFHYALGRELRAWRDRGLVIMGSGNIVHNLGAIRFEDTEPPPYDWAQEFDAWVKGRLLAGDHEALVQYASRGETARLAVPTNDHYLPMLYVLGLLESGEAIRFTHESFQNASISMRCFESA